ncbi:MAG: DM13 domain-containing protein [Spirulina sp.]
MPLKRFLLFSLSIPLMVACASGQSEALNDSAMPESSMPPSEDVVAEGAKAANESEAAASSEATAMANETMAGVIKSGTFVSGEKNTAGMARIINSDGQFFVELDETFQTSRGPDLVVVLHQSADVIGSTEPPAFPLQEGSYVSLGELESFSGAQRYAIAADLDLDAYPSVVIWCRRFNSTFGAASLQ